MRLMAVALAIAILLLAVLPAARAQAVCYSSRASIDVAGDLSLWAAYNVTRAPALIVLPAASPVAYQAVENGTTPLPISYNGTDLEVAVDEPGIVNVSYLTLQATSKTGDLWQAQLYMPCEGWLVMPPGSAPVQVSPLPIQVSYIDSSPELLLPEGQASVDYMLSPVTTTTAPAPVTTSSSTPTTTTARRPAGSEYYMIAAVAVVAAAVAAFLGLRAARGSREGEAAGPENALDDRDRAILDALARRGGEATASDLIKDTGIPKTPMYRRLSKLEGMGYIDEYMKGGVKVYRCKRPSCR
ncbi:MAG: helix-turn-helix transcriptional regulator [Acidilobus sp.]